MTDENSEQIRLDFPVTKKIVYMNNGAIAPTPLVTIKTMTDFMLKCAEEGPDSSSTAEYITSLLGELKLRVSHLIGCEPEEVVLVQSTTDGINLVANGIEWKKGDSIVVRGGRHEHYANYLPWLRLSQTRGVALKELDIDGNGMFDMGQLEKMTKGSRLVAMSHALYNTGAIMPVEQVGRIARENNLLFFVDAAQTAGTIKIDVKKIGCHFMAFPGFKWLCGPTGIGIFYCSKEASELLTPPSIGGESATLSSTGILAYMDMPARLQTGFRNYPGAAGLEASIRYVLRLGLDNIRSRNMKVANTLHDELAKIPGITMHGPDDPDQRTSIVTFTSSADSSSMVKKLESNNIVLAERDIGKGKKGVRAAPHFFNSQQEALQVASQVKSLI